MKRNKKVLLSVVLVLTAVLSFGCTNYSSSRSEKVIDEFLNKKADLYDNKDEIVSILIEEEKMNEVLKDIRMLLTEKEYERLMANRYIVDNNLVNESYDKAEIKNIKYEKVSKDTKKAVYIIKYTENLYFKDELKEEKDHTDNFILEKIGDEWLISDIR